jgi:hypothetical protein
VWGPGPGHSIRHYFRDGQTLNWTLAETLPQVSLAPNYTTNGYDCAGVPSFFGSTYFRNFEGIYLSTARQLRQCFFDQLASKWIDRGLFGPSDADGVPGVIQTNTGAPGNFEVVVRRSNGTLDNWLRDNADNTGQWTQRANFGTGILLSGAALTQRWAPGGSMTVGTAAGLDVVCVTTGNRMQRWWRDDVNNKPWVACETFGTNVASPPVMIRGQYGATEETVPGNYELGVAVNGEIQHWWTPGNPEPGTGSEWSQSATFGTNLAGQKVSAVLGLIESSFPFNLELVALLTNGSLQHFWRDGAGWHAGPVFGTEL